MVVIEQIIKRDRDGFVLRQEAREDNDVLLKGQGRSVGDIYEF